MKLSNLALRMERETELEAAKPVADTTAAADLGRAARRLERTRRLGLDYRAIVIRDDGLRPFRVR
jgi:hypothetical protein